MKKLEHYERHYIQRAIDTAHWISVNRNAFLTCQQMFGQYMDFYAEHDCPCTQDQSPEAEAFRACRPAMGLMFDLICAISRDDFHPERNGKFDGVVRQPNMLPSFPPSVLIPAEEKNVDDILSAAKDVCEAIGKVRTNMKGKDLDKCLEENKPLDDLWSACGVLENEIDYECLGEPPKAKEST